MPTKKTATKAKSNKDAKPNANKGAKPKAPVNGQAWERGEFIKLQRDETKQ